MRLRTLLWWGVTVTLLPLLLVLAVRVRRSAVRLQPASGPAQGVAGATFPGPPLRLALLGESTVAGVGVPLNELALAAQVGEALASRLQRPVAWRACGENGITAPQACERLLPQMLAEPIDLAIVVFGVNDTTHLSSLRAWTSALRQIGLALQGQGAQVLFAGVPPIQHFSALPWLLRQVLGTRGALLDEQLQLVCRELTAGYHPIQANGAAGYLAEDGYHPSALGYRVWAEGLAEAVEG